MENIIDIKNITTGYGKNMVLKNISLSVKKGESVAVVGPSSCGKSTLLRAVAGFNKLTQGEIKIRGSLYSDSKDGTFVAPEERKIGVVFQDYAVWPHMTVLENVIYPLQKAKYSKEEARKKAIEVIEKVQLTIYADRLPSQLSGGQQQRVALARALVSSDDIILLDEPITNLDASLRGEMAYEIQRLQREFGVTVLYITHDQEVAMTIGDRMVIMNNTGDIEQIGTPEEIWNDPVNQYVYKFLGVSNFMHVKYEDKRIHLLASDEKMSMAIENENLIEGKEYMMASRPIEVELEEVEEGADGFIAKMNRVTFLGPQFDYFLSIPGNEEIRVHQDAYEVLENMLEEGKFYRMKFKNPKFYDLDV